MKEQTQTINTYDQGEQIFSTNAFSPHVAQL